MPRRGSTVALRGLSLKGAVPLPNVGPDSNLTCDPIDGAITSSSLSQICGTSADVEPHWS